MAPRFLRTSLSCFTLFVLSISLAAQTVPCGQWQPIPASLPDGALLRAVAARSPDLAWTVGSLADSSGATFNLTAAWNGTTWNVVPVPSLPGGDNVLSGVAIVAADDVWAVGTGPSTAPGGGGFALHWDGKEWTFVPVPFVTGGSTLSAVAALAADDVWAVGIRAGGLPQATSIPWILHWDGSAWHEVAAPSLGNRSNHLVGIAAVSAQDIWAVGTYRDIGGLYQMFVLHYDGQDWKVVPAPVLASENDLHAVAASGPQQVIAIGARNDGILPGPIALLWDGVELKELSMPGNVAGIVALAPSDFWAAGSDFVHFDGSAWSLVPDPALPDGAQLHLLAITGTGEVCDGWAIGRGILTDGSTRPALLRLQSSAATLNQPPVAIVEATPSDGISPLTVHFSSAGSHDPDGSVVKYYWEFGDTPTAPSTEANPTHIYTYDAPGTFYARLTVTDDRGGTASAAVPIHVTPPPRVLSAGRNGAGGGAVTSTPDGIDCGSLCSASFQHGMTVNLTASPAAGSVFKGWGGACSGTGACAVTLDADKNVMASFNLVPAFDFAPPPTAQTVAAGQAAHFTIDLRSQAGYQGMVSFACTAGVPRGAACSFSPSTASLASGATSTVLSITTTPRTVAGLPSLGLVAAVFMAPVLLPLTQRLRRRALPFAALVLLSITLMASCGGGGGSTLRNNSPSALGTPAGSHNITVTATSGSIVRTQTVVLVVN